ncbi:MAG TPA: hypothetical protein VIS96_13275 [Terrimicrobiaceae bacterium]
MAGFPDYDAGLIQTERDLEDFARLHFYINAFDQELADGKLKVGLTFEPAGDPKMGIGHTLRCQ